MSEDPILHGTTYGMAQRCYHSSPRGCCTPCRKVWTAYIKQWRAAGSAAVHHAKFMDEVRQRALWRLARLYPDEFHALVDEEARRPRKSGVDTSAQRSKV